MVLGKQINKMKKIIITIFLFISFNSFSQGVHLFGINAIPKTGQTTTFHNSRDDGGLQYGSPTTPRFVDNGDSTITDKVTGLMWARDLGGRGAGLGLTYTWDSTFVYDSTLNLASPLFAGHNDWRVPNAIELMSIYNFGKTTMPAFYSPFSNNSIYVDNIWTSTTPAVNTTSACRMDFDPNDGLPSSSSAKTNKFHIILVRGGKK